MEMAKSIRSESDDPKAKFVKSSGVGAVITLNNNVLVAVANGFPPKLRESVALDDQNSPDRYVFLEHAERRAIFEGFLRGESFQGGTMYCTRFPCIDCARAIVYSGIERFVVGQGFGAEERWLESQRSALRILRLGNITVRYLLD